MKNHYDPWYVRLPDGRIVKAKSTSSVRHHVQSGNIPLNSSARREHHEEWVGLGRIAEFSDLSAGGDRSTASMHDSAPLQSANGSSPEINLRSGISSRLDPMRLQTVGVRGLVDELIAAFDSTVGAGKLVVACAVATFGSLAVFLALRLVLVVLPEGVWLAQVVGGLIGLFFLAVIVGLLTRQTHLELSKMRPVYPSEAFKAIVPFVFRVFLGYAVTIGVGIGLLILLQQVPGWVSSGTGTPNEILPTAVWSASIVLALGIFVMIMLSLLMPPILVVEECSVGDALREWRAILREHRIRVIVYEGMALALAIVASLPLALPVQLAIQFAPTLGAVPPNWIGAAIPFMLYALAAGPAIAFLAVANLFIYLNLRYEYSPQK
jgi:hypothetical protein